MTLARLPLPRFHRHCLGTFGRALLYELGRERGDGEAVFGEYRDDPVRFARDVLGVRLWSAQKRILCSVRDNKATAVASAHGVGKSFIAGVAVVWWMCTRSPARVFTTAPTHRQVIQILWRQVQQVHRRAKRRLPGKVLSAQWRIGVDRLATGASGKNSDSVQGIHSESVLIVFDEASGVPDEIAAALDGALTSDDARTLALGNPTGQQGFFRDAFVGKSKHTWHAINISALRTPNVRSGRTLIPGLIDRAWVDRVREVYGASSPFYKNRVLGEFVSAEAGERVVPEDWVDLAKARWDSVPEAPVEILAVDIARSGDDSTAIVALAGRRLYRVEAMHIADLMAITDRIIEFANQLRPRAVHIDATGLGVGVFDRLNQQQHLLPAGTEIRDVVLGRSSSNKEVWPRLLDEIQWLMREAFDPSNPACVAVDPDDHELATQLCLRTWRLDERSRIKVETKNDLQRRGAASPDLADAAMLCFTRHEDTWVNFI